MKALEQITSVSLDSYTDLLTNAACTLDADNTEVFNRDNILNRTNLLDHVLDLLAAAEWFWENNFGVDVIELTPLIANYMKSIEVLLKDYVLDYASTANTTYKISAVNRILYNISNVSEWENRVSLSSLINYVAGNNDLLDTNRDHNRLVKKLLNWYRSNIRNSKSHTTYVLTKEECVSIKNMTYSLIKLIVNLM